MTIFTNKNFIILAALQFASIASASATTQVLQQKVEDVLALHSADLRKYILVLEDSLQTKEQHAELQAAHNRLQAEHDKLLSTHSRLQAERDRLQATHSRPETKISLLRAEIGILRA